MIILFLLLLSIVANGAVWNTSVYKVEFTSYLHTDLDNVERAIKRQVNHTFGPSTVFKRAGQNSSFSHNFEYEVLKITKIDNSFRRVDYRYKGNLVAENGLDLNNFKTYAPIYVRGAFNKSNGRCASSLDLVDFYFSWHPKFKKCNLIEDHDYLKIKLDTYKKVDDSKPHYTKEFLNDGKYNLFYYFGADKFSLKRSKMGFALTNYKDLVRFYKRRKGFYKDFDVKEKKIIFNKEKTHSFYTKFIGHIDGIETNVYIMAGNPTESTPIAKYEFFKFFKYAFKKGSAISYSGHAGLGSILDFDAHEQEYGEKIDYSAVNKQLLLLSGCGTFLHSSGFFFDKRRKKDSLVLITNGLFIFINSNKKSSYVIADTFRRKTFFTNRDLQKKFMAMIKASNPNMIKYPMPAVESN
ncbi:MAG: hypothetical protein N4A33_04940 [Bacteriovoracaceae bacterium]|nr:hypothetical protein [Bacteriovoracaceae bacterium]